MKPVDFHESNVIYAKNQPEYFQLPAHKLGDQSGQVVCCWKLSWWERLRLIFTGRLCHSVLTFRQPLQPQLLSVDKPEELELEA